MSAYIVSKPHIDLMVRAAMNYGGHGGKFRWWRVNEDGEYDGWHELDPLAEQDTPANPEYLVKVTPSYLGQILVNENVRSILGRYPDCDADTGDLPGPIDAYYMGPYIYTDPGYVLSPGEVFKALDCYAYQSCEHDEWRKSEAFAFCDALRHAACAEVAGYDAAPWGYDEVPSREQAA